ncbi:MAG: response regulator [Thermoanaerobaculia bacterium]
MNRNDASAASYQLRLFGEFELVAPSGASVPLSSRKAQVLIAYLAQRAGQGVSRGKLAAMLWSDSREPESRHSLRQCLLILHKALGDRGDLLAVEQESVRLREERVSLDVAAFERHVAMGTEEALREANRLYRGEFLEGLQLPGEPIHDWILFERRRLAHLAKKGLLPLLEATETSAGIEDAMQIATRLLAIDPQQHDVQSTLVRLYGGAHPSSRRSLGRTILVADPDASARSAVAAALRLRGYDVVECADGGELLIEVGATDPDAVVADIALPPFGPIPIVRAIAARRPRIPVLCTGEEQEEKEAEGLAAGAADFLRKPLDPEVLLLRLENAMRQLAPRETGAG